MADIEKEAGHQEKDALATYGMLEGADARISPLRRALAVWGLTGDDIGVLSIHGTNTGVNFSYTRLSAESLLKFFNRRKTRLERYLRISSTYSWQRSTRYGSEKSSRTLEGRIGCSR